MDILRFEVTIKDRNDNCEGMSLRGLSTDKLKNFLITLDANYGLTIRPSPTTVNNFGVLFCIVEAYLSSFGHLEQRLSNISH